MWRATLIHLIVFIIASAVFALSELLFCSTDDDYNIHCGLKQNLSESHYLLKGKMKITAGEIVKGFITVNIPNIVDYEAVIGERARHLQG